MYTFGMLGSYFSQGVYAVAQGAVDIIVVQQEDGTFKSSPWYVKCGDFQGVMKRREKIVNISVNGVQANFYMLLNNKGEAYFEKELEDAPLALPSASSSADDKKGNGKTKADDTKQNGETKGSASSKSVTKEKRSQLQDTADADSDASFLRNGANQMSGLLGDLPQEGPSGMWEPPCTVSGDSCDLGAAELSDPKTVSSDKRSNLQDVAEVDSVRKDVIINRGTSISNLMDVAGSFSATAEERLDLWEAPSIRIEVNPGVISIDGDNFSLPVADDIFPDQLAKEERLRPQQVFNIESDVETAGACHDGDSPHLLVTDDGVLNAKTADACTDGDSPSLLLTDDAVLCNLKTVIAEDWFGLQKATSSGSGGEATCALDDLDNSDAKAMDEVIWNDYKVVIAQEEKELQDALNMASVVGVCIDGDSWKSGATDDKNSEQVDSSIWISDGPVNEDMSKVVVAISEDNGLLVDECSGHTSTDGVILDKEIVCKVEEGSGHTSTDNVMLDKEIVCKVEEGSPTEGSKDAEIPTIAVVPSPSRWTMWPLSFRRSRADKPPVSEAIVTRQALLAATKIAIGSPLTEEILRKNGYYEWPQKPKLRTYVPTSGQIESLKLKEGPNKVTFTFPRVLGKTQVDAHIYLWKWNTRIVISDVDGTITKSDVLGQVMPLVGRDWSQSGVTRLFSAIKENGYEVLFLSARAISQAYLTRQFLVNLKQDGEALPEGPVFISPDGLIPSLYREVIRRTPHEFKISCLEEIRRLFPSDVNPFYAGFGNRDTDEISYRKVGIPRGKIFIINPKGEVMVNHHVDVKSYTSIHALVDDMFPPVSSSEQEDFNSWNFWKLPLPDIVDELSAKSSKKTKRGGSSKK